MMTSPNGNISALLALFAGIHRSPVNSPHKGQWRGALMFSLICTWINGWVNNREAGDLRRHRAHIGVIVMRQSIEVDLGFLLRVPSLNFVCSPVQLFVLYATPFFIGPCYKETPLYYMTLLGSNFIQHASSLGAWIRELKRNCIMGAYRHRSNCQPNN